MTTAAALVTRHPALRHTGTSKMHLPTLRKAGEILDDLEAGRGKTLAHVWGYDPNTRNTEHHSGRALDFMVHNDRAAGDHIANYVIANKERLGLIHIIWRQRIYRGPRSTSKNPKGAWYKMADRGDPTQNHMDHPHAWFAATGYTPLTPAVEPTTLTTYLTRGSTGPEVRLLQRMLNGMDNAGLTLDGSFGPAVQTAVRSAQIKRKLTADGQVGPATRARFNADWKAHNTPPPPTEPPPPVQIPVPGWDAVLTEADHLASKASDLRDMLRSIDHEEKS